ncbi:sodium/calcium exchanger 1-like [Dysidea avara]|uniref:sodium/calcium exchanger 1-like n=1 Tax=Dysidea avara TaxID=196820 RepID=UPI00331CF9ED
MIILQDHTTLSSGDIGASFNISVTDDNVLETNEQFLLSIDPSSLPDGVTVGSISNATVTIVDINTITVNISKSIYNVGENDGGVQLMLILSNPASPDIIICVDTTDGEGVGANEDYFSGPYFVVFPARMTQAVFNILLIDDNISEETETFINSSSLPNNVTIGELGEAEVTSLDNVGFTAQMLKICRTPGPTACLKKVCLKRWRKEKKIHGSLEPAAIRLTLEHLQESAKRSECFYVIAEL